MTNIFFILLSVFLLPSFGHAEDLKETLFKEAERGHISFSYSDARKKLFNEIYLEKDSDGHFIEGVYCREKYYPFAGEHPNGRLPDHTQFNTEHTWPQSKFSRRFLINTQKTDLHHLFPTFSKINSERGNLPFAEVHPGKELSCDESHIGHATQGGDGKYFEPPREHRGNVARAMFYFAIRYQMAIDPTQEHYLRMWHKEDPVDENERIRHAKIFKIQGNKNPFIENPSLVDQIQNF